MRLEPVAQRAAAMLLAHNEKEPALQVLPTASLIQIVDLWAGGASHS